MTPLAPVGADALTDRLTQQETCALLDRLPEASPTDRRRLRTEIYEELRTIADALFSRERRDHTLQPTALVHEALLRLAGQRGLESATKTRFLVVAAGEMRRVLIDHARRRAAKKRGGAGQRLTLDEAALTSTPRQWDAVIFAETLERLGKLSSRQLQVVELRIFGGMTMAEVAASLGLSTTTVEDDWYAARAWLRRELSGTGT